MTREELKEEIHQEIEEEEKTNTRKKWVKLGVKILVLAILFIISFYAYTTYISTVKVKVREYRIIHENLPDSFNGLKIIQFSDLHYGSTMFQEDFVKIQKKIQVRKPDIIVFTGDLLYPKYKLSKEEQEFMIQELKKMDASLGKYAILGDEDDEVVLTIFNQSNFTVLRNEAEVIVRKDNTPIFLVGLSSKDKDLQKAYGSIGNQYTITLVHEPDTVDEVLNSYHSDLFLAGHSHNGTIRIPFIHKGIIPTKGALHYNQDYYRVQDADLYISGGLGTENGIRLFCRPSINFFRLSNH